MLALINTNRMVPPIAPLGVEYVAGAARRAGVETTVLDLCLAEQPDHVLEDYFGRHSPQLVGLSFRNVDDCFWPSAESFLQRLVDDVHLIRTLTDAPIVVGGVGFSIFPQRIVESAGVEFGIHGDGEQSIVALYNAIEKQEFANVPGLVYRRAGTICSNRPAWPTKLTLPVGRDAVDNRAYFRRGGQGGIETKRGCNRKCIYCADPLAKGPMVRTRQASEVADELEVLVHQGVNVLHLCDSEFNIPREHAFAVCEELKRRGLGKRVRWYAYMAVVPFDAELAQIMREAGCIGINFTGDSGCPAMLHAYRQQHTREDLATAVKLCRRNTMAVMFDLMLGGPGETQATAAESIEYIKQIGPDCAGAALGIRIYPGTGMEKLVLQEGPLEDNPSIVRRYDGPVDFFRPTFYISQALGPRPARLVKDLIAGDQRFFEPIEAAQAHGEPSTDHNYSDNTELVQAIENGRRGAYWDILRKLRQ